jgi:3-dehydroquinate dehydratase/shikimate dehydrogenase
VVAVSRRATIVATLASEPEASLLAEAEAAGAILEIRADLIGDPDVDWLRSQFSGEILYTLRSEGEGGGFRGGEAERAERLVAAAGYDLVDLEAERDLTDRTLREIEPARRLISWHGPPVSPAQLRSRARQMASTAARFRKLVPKATDEVTAMAPVSALGELSGDNLVMFASGVAGAWTRLVSALLGAPVVFGYLGSRQGAPGQLSVRRLVEDYGLPRLPHVERLFGVVGSPIEHSLSPRLHNGIYRHLDVPAWFVPFHVDAFGDFWLRVVESGTLDLLGLPLAGLSVTTPHKEIALAVAGASSPIASRIGAANTLVLRNRVWEAEATDPEGVILPLQDRQVLLTEAQAAVVGVGGAGRSAAVALQLAGARVTLVNRSTGRGVREATRLGLPFVPWSDLDPGEYDVLVNATPLGRGEDDEEPFSIEAVRRGCVVVDMVYHHDGETALVRAARNRELTVVDGREVLLCQAGHQFHMMTGREFPMAEARRLLDVGPVA